MCLLRKFTYVLGTWEFSDYILPGFLGTGGKIGDRRFQPPGFFVHSASLLDFFCISPWADVTSTTAISNSYQQREANTQGPIFGSIFAPKVFLTPSGHGSQTTEYTLFKLRD